MASLLVPRRGAPVLLNRIHHNWHEKLTRVYERRYRTGWRDPARGEVRREEVEAGSRFERRSDQRLGAAISGNFEIKRARYFFHEIACTWASAACCACGREKLFLQDIGYISDASHIFYCYHIEQRQINIIPNSLDSLNVSVTFYRYIFIVILNAITWYQRDKRLSRN